MEGEDEERKVEKVYFLRSNKYRIDNKPVDDEEKVERIRKHLMRELPEYF